MSIFHKYNYFSSFEAGSNKLNKEANNSAAQGLNSQTMQLKMRGIEMTVAIRCLTLSRVSIRSHRCSYTCAWISGSFTLLMSPSIPSMRLHNTTATSGVQPISWPPDRILRESSPDSSSEESPHTLCANENVTLPISLSVYKNKIFYILNWNAQLKKII